LLEIIFPESKIVGEAIAFPAPPLMTIKIYFGN